MRWCFSFAFVLMVALSAPAKAMTVGEWMDRVGGQDQVSAAAARGYALGAWRALMLSGFAPDAAGKRMDRCVREERNLRVAHDADFASRALDQWIRIRINSATDVDRQTLRAMDIVPAVWLGAELMLVC